MIVSIRRWWNTRGSEDYPQARRLLVTADAGASNGYRTRAWQAELTALAVAWDAWASQYKASPTVPPSSCVCSPARADRKRQVCHQSASSSTPRAFDLPGRHQS